MTNEWNDMKQFEQTSFPKWGSLTIVDFFEMIDQNQQWIRFRKEHVERREQRKHQLKTPYVTPTLDYVMKRITSNCTITEKNDHVSRTQSVSVEDRSKSVEKKPMKEKSTQAFLHPEKKKALVNKIIEKVDKDKQTKIQWKQVESNEYRQLYRNIQDTQGKQCVCQEVEQFLDQVYGSNVHMINDK